MPYGSLGSNGVLMIKTERGKVSRTLVELQSVEGVGFINKTSDFQLEGMTILPMPR